VKNKNWKNGESGGVGGLSVKKNIYNNNMMAKKPCFLKTFFFSFSTFSDLLFFSCYDIGGYACQLPRAYLIPESSTVLYSSMIAV